MELMAAIPKDSQTERRHNISLYIPSMALHCLGFNPNCPGGSGWRYLPLPWHTGHTINKFPTLWDSLPLHVLHRAGAQYSLTAIKLSSEVPRLCRLCNSTARGYR